MKKQFMGKHRKHFITLTCLVAGMLVLTTAVYANYDDAGGYTNYKSALKNLAFEAGNFTADAEMTLIMDGEEEGTTKATYKFDDGNSSQHMIYNENFDGEKSGSENYYYTMGKTTYNYYPDSNEYYERKNDTNSSGTLIPLEDGTAKKAVRFAELMADTCVGDLKNNVVLTSEKDGVKEYSISVKKNQIPEIVNAGLSLMFTANNSRENNSSYVTYDDYERTFAAFYLEKTGKEFVEPDYEKEAEIEAFDKYYEEFHNQYQDVLEDKGNEGMLVVLADGSYEYFSTYDKYVKSEYASNEIDMMAKFGNEPYVDDVTCNVTLDDEGRLISNYLEVSLVGTDEDGVKHTATMKINAKIYDYDNTTVDKFDTEGKKKIN